MKKALLSLLCLLTLAAAVPAFADTELDGQTAGGAYYKIIVPDDWDGTLVLWNHGFDLDPISPLVDLGPVAELQAFGDFAVAATTLRENGWAMFRSKADLQLLLDVFEANFGVPDQIVITGASFGGLVTAEAIEKANLGNVTGALTICGAMGGSRNWDAALDSRLIYDMVCSKVPEARLPGGATGLEKDSPLTEQQVEDAINACMGLDLPAGQRSNQQKKAIRQFTQWTTVPEEFILRNMGYATFALSDLIFDRGKLKGRQGVGNDQVDYGVKRVNKRIERVTPKAGAARKLAKRYTPTGRVGNTKILSIHTDKDGLVFVENEGDWASVVPPENLTVGIVVEDEPTHCGFSAPEVVAAFLTLLDWIEGGPQPTTDTLQDECEDVEPFFDGECRYDPDFVLQGLDTRIPPRVPRQ